jgi:hypothetical protein
MPLHTLPFHLLLLLRMALLLRLLLLLLLLLMRNVATPAAGQKRKASP